MIYYLNFCIEFFLGLNLFNSGYSNGIKIRNDSFYLQKKAYCIICGVFWILISGLRGLSVGADTLAYKISFETVKNYPLNYVFQGLKDKYILGEGSKDPGYNILVKFFQFFSDNYQVYLIFIAAIFMIPFTIWIFRESKNPCISFILYSSLFYSFFSLTGHRQTIALSMTVLIGDKFIKERKILPFVIITLIASTIHASALVFLPFYFLSRIPVRRKTIMAWSLSILISILARHQLKYFFIQLSGYDGYSKDYEGAGAYTFSILIFILFIWSMFSRSLDRDIEKNRRFYNALFLALFFLPLIWLNPSAMRVVQYFSIYLVLLIPEMVDSTFTAESKSVASGIIAAMLFLLLIKNNPQYTFFWQ